MLLIFVIQKNNSNKKRAVKYTASNIFPIDIVNV